MSRQAWYDHQWRREAELLDEGKVLEIVRATRAAHEGLDNCSAKLLYRIVKPELERNGVKMGRDKFFDVLRRHGQSAKRRRTRARTTFSDVNLPLFPDIAKGMKLGGPELLLVGDITYIRVGDHFNYLSLLTDAYSHRIMGYCLCETLKTEGCLVALEMAIANLAWGRLTAIHHSDRGFQYRSQEYLKVLRSAGFGSSMTQSGDPLENAVAERVNGILKVDMGLGGKVFANHAEAVRAVDAVILTYNGVRPHSSVDYLVPIEAHRREGQLRNHWKKKGAVADGTA